MTDTRRPLRRLGDDPGDYALLTLSRQLRAVLYRAGVVASPELPTYPIPPDMVATDSPSPTPATISARVETSGAAYSVHPASAE